MNKGFKFFSESYKKGGEYGYFLTILSEVEVTKHAIDFEMVKEGITPATR